MSAVVAGVRTMLAAQEPLTDLLGTDDVFDTWLFQDQLYTVVERSGSVAVVLQQRGQWTSPNAHNTMRFPRLWVGIYADPERDPSGHVVERNAGDRVEAVFDALDRHLHRPQGGTVLWGDLRVLGSQRLGEVDFFPVSDGDGMTRGEVTYGVTLG